MWKKKLKERKENVVKLAKPSCTHCKKDGHDDEHCWSDHGIFNIEGGCYAKCIDLSAEKEPEIYNAIRFGAVLENVVYDETQRIVDFSNPFINIKWILLKLKTLGVLILLNLFPMQRFHVVRIIIIVFLIINYYITTFLYSYSSGWSSFQYHHVDLRCLWCFTTCKPCSHSRSLNWLLLKPCTTLFLGTLPRLLE